MTADTPLPYDDIVWACTNLCELLEVENEALAQHDVQTVRELADNKAALAKIYERSLMPMAEDPTLADALEPEQKEELMELGHRLHAIVEKNALLLRAQIDAYDKLMGSVVSAVKESATLGGTYAKDGSFDAHPSSDANSISYNRTL